MASHARAPVLAPVSTYQPMEWRQTFGKEVEHDAQACAAIQGPDPATRRERRKKEIQRIADLYGKPWARKVRDRVEEIFRERT